jgi:hypothetical protein
MGADAPVEALGYFERAMVLLDTLPDTEINRRRRLALVADQIVVFQNLFRMQQYYELLTQYEPLAVELNDPALLGPVIQQIGHCDWTFGGFEHAHNRFATAAKRRLAAGRARAHTRRTAGVEKKASTKKKPAIRRAKIPRRGGGIVTG